MPSTIPPAMLHGKSNRKEIIRYRFMPFIFDVKIEFVSNVM
jgi:hypothetical protein